MNTFDSYREPTEYIDIGAILTDGTMNCDATICMAHLMKEIVSFYYDHLSIYIVSVFKLNGSVKELNTSEGECQILVFKKI